MLERNTRHPDASEFKDLLRSWPLEDIVDRHVFEGTPYVFRDPPEAFDALRHHLSSRLGLAEENFVVVGSAKMGFSLSPDTFPRQFSDDSDIDVLVVDPALFDRVWFTMLDWHYPRRRVRLDGVEGQWTGTRRKELYWGWFVPDKIRYEGLAFPQCLKPMRDISTNWFNAFQSLGLVRELSSRDISGRLYRTWEHALAYHVDGLRQIRSKLLQTQKGA